MRRAGESTKHGLFRDMLRAELRRVEPWEIEGPESDGRQSWEIAIDLRRAKPVAAAGFLSQQALEQASTQATTTLAVLSDAELKLTKAWLLPTFVAAGQTLLKRLTLVIGQGRVEHLWYPVFPPDTHAEKVLAWLREHPAS